MVYNDAAIQVVPCFNYTINTYEFNSAQQNICDWKKDNSLINVTLVVIKLLFLLAGLDVFWYKNNHC